jgi:transcriptional regulator with XRE-family HTH domain
MATGSENTAEAAFASNLRSARAAKGMTQAQLAEAMAARGFRWHPPTVYKVESGERQIQLGEAVELSRILGLPLEDMATPGNSNTQRRVEIGAAERRVASSQLELAHLIFRYLSEAQELTQLLKDTPDLEKLCTGPELERLKSLSQSNFDDALVKFAVASLRSDVEQGALREFPHIDNRLDDAVAIVPVETLGVFMEDTIKNTRGVRYE